MRDRATFRERVSLWMRELAHAVTTVQESAVTELPRFLRGEVAVADARERVHREVERDRVPVGAVGDEAEAPSSSASSRRSARRSRKRLTRRNLRVSWNSRLIRCRRGTSAASAWRRRWSIRRPYWSSMSPQAGWTQPSDAICESSSSASLGLKIGP